MTDDDLEDAVLDVLGAADDSLSAEEVQTKISDAPALANVRVALRKLVEQHEIVRPAPNQWRAREPSPIALERRQSGFTREELARARARFKITDCPHCGKHGDVDTLFGWRRMEQDDKDLQPQSWCFACRQEDRRRRQSGRS